MTAAFLFGASSALRAADKLMLSSTNPTAFEIDHVVAKEKGFFAKENLEVEVNYMTPDLVVKALIAGAVDIARSGSHFGLIAAARGAEIKIIGGSNYGYPYQVIGNPQFKTLTDLKGQKIAGASIASITTTIFKDVMQRRGIPPSAYTLLFVGGSPERFQAVASGQVAASLAEAPPYQFQVHRSRPQSFAQLFGRDQKFAVHRLFRLEQIAGAKPAVVYPLYPGDRARHAMGERPGQ